MTLPPLNADLLAILGRPNFACANLASALRADGREIPRKAEAEQAHVIHWMLGIYLEHGAAWDAKVGEELQRIADQVAARRGVA
jgi:hypothetical protein